jgi:hypothetical protein
MDEGTLPDKGLGMRLRPLLIFCAFFFYFLGPQSCPAASNLSTDGRFFSFSSQNDSYAQVLDTFHQQAGVECDVPPELRNQRIPLVEIKGLTLKSALVKILEGSHFDYILISSPGDPEKVRKLIVTGRSVQAASSTGQGPPTNAAMVPRRVNRQMAEDPFGGGADMGIEDAAGNDPMMITPVAENPPVQGQGVPQPTPPGATPQQSQPIQTQQLQSAPGLQQQSIGQPLPPMTPQQVMPGQSQQPQQGNNPSTRRTPF